VLPPPAIRGARRPCPRVARSTVQWIGTTLGRPLRRTRDAGVCPPRPSPPAAAGPTRCGQVTCAAVLAQPRARLRDPPFTSSASPRARVRRGAAATARTDATELWAPVALRLPLSWSTTHAQSQRCGCACAKKGSVSEAPAHVSVLLDGACGGGGSTVCVYRWQEQQPGKTWEVQCPSTGCRTLGFSAH
jgi:hypothetical protein